MTSKTTRFYFIGLALFIFCLLDGNQVATMQEREIASALLTPAPAAGIQIQPQIAKGANSSLAVWSDRRTVLNRYVPDDNAGIGSDTDIYAARYDAQGNLIDTIPIVINEAIYEQYSPHVAWNGQNWLVTWITKRRTNQFDIDILAVRVAPDGRVLDPAPIPVYITPDFEGDPSYVATASDGVNWTVVFGQASFGSKIVGVRVAPDGSLIDATPKILFEDEDFTAPGEADIAYSNNQFLLVWAITLGSEGAVRTRRISNNLDPIASAFAVNLFNPSSGRTPRVASDGTNFLVTWREDRFAYSEMFAARVSAAGQVLDPNGIKFYGTLTDYIFQFQNSLCWDGASYVAAYHARPGGGGESIFATRISTGGTFSPPVPVALNNGSTQPAVSGLAGGVKIVWVDQRLSADGDIFGANLAADNTLSAVAPASLAAPRETQIRFAKTEAGDFAYSYRSTVSGASSIRLQRLAADGNAIGEPTLVTQGAEAIFNPSVAWNGSVYLVIWELNGQTFGRRVAADGTTPGAEFFVSSGNMPDVAALGTQFLVVNSFPRTSQLRHTQATRVGGDGTIATPVRIGNSFDLRPRVRAFANRWLVVWESDLTHDYPNSTIAAAFVETDGTSPGEFSINGLFSDAPSLAIGGDTALVVWQNGGKIYGRRVKNDGTFLGNTFLIAGGPRSLFAASAAWDGSRFVVTFADSRNSTILPPPDVWATLVGLNGSLLTPTHFPVAAVPLPEEMPSVEAANGVTVFGYSQFDDRAPYASYRARLRRFPFDTTFNVSVTPYQRQIAPGGTTTYAITVNPQNNFNGAISLSVYGLPDGATATINPATITGGGSATLIVTTSNTTPEDIYRLTITATSGAQQSTTEAVLFVDDNPPPIGYAVTDLGTLGGAQSAAFGINQSGQVVGFAFNAAQKRRAFLYANGQMEDLGTLGGQTATAFGINDAGKAVGISGINSFEDERAFFYDGATMRNLGVIEPSGNVDYSHAFAVNNSNQIVGETSTVSGQRIAFLFQNNLMKIVGTPFAFDSAYDINNAGKIVGSEYVGGSITKSYIIGSDNTNPVFIETLGGRNSYARAVNNNNQVVGSSDYSLNNIFQHAFLYSSGQLRDINGLGAPQSFAYDINDAGMIVGNVNLTSFGDSRAFIHDGTTMRNLNSLIPQNSGWVLQEARGINNAGQIAGRGTINNQTRAFLLNPNSAQNSPPTVQIVSPVQNSNFGNADGITISADAFDPDGAIARVEFYADGILIGAATSQPYVILWTNAIANHTYALTAKAFDNSGATTVSAPVTITVGISQSARTKFDFDGDGKTDVSVFRPENGTWYLQNSASGFSAVPFGVGSDRLVPADYDGDGRTDVAVYRGGTWYLQRSSLGFTGVAFGDSNDIPVPADYDADGKAEIAVFRPSNGAWYSLNLVSNQFNAVQFGQAGDKPVAADYDGDGRADVAVFRPSNGYWYQQRSTLGFTGVAFGEANDKPVAADYDGDGKVDIAVFRTSNGTWYLQRSRDGFTGFAFGLGTDIPTPADYDGDGKTDVAVFRDGTWYLQRSQAGFAGVSFGAATDTPVPNAFVR